ncbi:MAG: hypothetical protein COZ06_38825 [Armatimonadetes bacterium CG_4_10_14_3_um_filter_66_18]|nr:hypothetical protein [Armatimonadota bacterium]OIO93242.1 MAG: hypothetical protein AUJ96_30765 [Armatimonadetes bacterium CG2_30_66_41]PIU92569.1 MAG: hypothetical protein COS65_17225 [Armatimonadetes bacterium CG06_land_8_20_14_3_00_66_21]PIX37516.1 MAG: hypothetical protein COZ57_33915 [Armatimonadetes bacterium CG_4_8_14_3_um_filter_66_20]PIY35112.1 MAG: hypothetical protein COZ06_38825 [Armatimonadetes bacterium CG_4_10_14_3_um_filter_66_18]PIZ35714.1 MAG: hypothetical protein COY42_26
MEHPTRLVTRYVNRQVALPYELTVDEIEQAVAETYRLYHGINDFLVRGGFRPMEELVLGNSLSGLLSEFLVKNIATASTHLEANLKVGGHPDLLPKGYYSSNLVLKGDEGIEVKSSIQKGGWQGHNPEDCWVMIFRYAVGEQEGGERMPLTFVEILCAKLTKADWSYSGRKGDSRRTPTASITMSGVEKLRRNFLYRVPGAGVRGHRALTEQ